MLPCAKLEALYWRNQKDTMKITILAVGKRMPDWVRLGFTEYSRRMPKAMSVTLREINMIKRGKNADIKHIVQEEGQRILAAIPAGEHVLALDVKGNSWSTKQLTNEMTEWQAQFSRISLLIGGPEGLSEACMERANGSWSLSALTLPHPLVRVIVAEQLYRSWSLLNRHPYHR